MKWNKKTITHRWIEKTNECSQIPPSIPNTDLIERNCRWARISIHGTSFIENAQWLSMCICNAFLFQSHVFDHRSDRRIIICVLWMNALINRRPHFIIFNGSQTHTYTHTLHHLFTCIKFYCHQMNGHWPIILNVISHKLKCVQWGINDVLKADSDEG